ncbi:bZIP transcription factor 23 [Arachis duranensis]|uniref:BZIP transcription factor 23 n=1 Tax=Arachis duranensis TaxID=130453 RepID=A0A6P4BZS7_ARADU|nr:bZIP transcription factor 23 [Arachis duranensis]
MNFKNFGNDPGPAAGGSGDAGGRPPGNFPLTRQPSVYNLTFDEFMNTMGGSGKDFGSMNMDELLKNIWTAEEVQTMASATGVGGEPGSAGFGGAGINNLQRQGSLTLPRTLSQKTVDEVWKDISKEYGGGSTGGGGGGPNPAQTTQRQPTLKEITLEEFLVRAGVVREDAQLAAAGKANDSVFVDLSRGGGNSGGLGVGFQQLNKVPGLMGDSVGVNNNDPLVGLQPRTNLPVNVNGVRSSNQQMQIQNSQSPHQHQPQIFPKQAPMSYAMPLVQGGGGGMGMVGLSPGPVHVATGSPASQISNDKMAKSNGDTSSVSPVPYVFNGGLRGRKSGGAVEKVIERRQRRMIKNRESAARSRARKQAYTMELEAEVQKLKEENQELQKKQEEIMEIQKNQVMEMMNLQQNGKRRCLRRTQTGPW